MRIAILSPSITTADAVSNDALGMFETLTRNGISEVRVFAEGSTIQDESVQPSNKIKSFLKNSSDILIYHYARGWEPGVRLLKDLRCRKVIKYHNITPPEFFAPYNQDIARICREGQSELKIISQSDSDLFLADSAYNLQELIRNGAPATRSHVLAPFHHTDRLQSTAADEALLKEPQNGKVRICTVGRVAPNKGHVSLIQAFAAYHYGYNRNSSLVIIGKQETRLRRYSEVLHEMIRRMGLAKSVIFTGAVSDSALKSYYQVATVFVATSNHEGFCVPLIEAMAMGLPIIAYASSAIPETIGPAGIVWEERNPYLLAESINAIVSDAALRAGLSALGWRRYDELFTNQRVEKQLLRMLEKLLAR